MKWFVSEFGRMRHAMFTGTSGESVCSVTYSGKDCHAPDSRDVRNGALTCMRCAGALLRIEEIGRLGITAVDAPFISKNIWRYSGPRVLTRYRSARGARQRRAA